VCGVFVVGEHAFKARFVLRALPEPWLVVVVAVLVLTVQRGCEWPASSRLSLLQMSAFQYDADSDDIMDSDEDRSAPKSGVIRHSRLARGQPSVSQNGNAGMWTCSKCTLHNEANAKFCDACHSSAASTKAATSTSIKKKGEMLPQNMDGEDDDDDFLSGTDDSTDSMRDFIADDEDDDSNDEYNDSNEDEDEDEKKEEEEEEVVDNGERKSVIDLVSSTESKAKGKVKGLGKGANESKSSSSLFDDVESDGDDFIKDSLPPPRKAAKKSVSKRERDGYDDIQTSDSEDPFISTRPAASKKSSKTPKRNREDTPAPTFADLPDFWSVRDVEEKSTSDFVFKGFMMLAASGSKKTGGEAAEFERRKLKRAEKVEKEKPKKKRAWGGRGGGGRFAKKR